METLRTYTETQGIALADFSISMRDLLQAKTKLEKESAIKQHRDVVEKCIDLGLVETICELRDKWNEYYG